KKKKTQSYIEKTGKKLSELESDQPPNHLADIIMANLHQIPKGADKATLFDFYNNREIEVTIKKGFSPQKQAEILYRKSKNRRIETRQLQNNLQEKQIQLQLIESRLGDLLEINDFKELRTFARENSSASLKKEQTENVPYKK